MKSDIDYIKSYFKALSALSIVLLIMLSFQNCSNARFSSVAYAELASSSSVQSFSTEEETTLEAQPKTFSSISGRKSVFTITIQPTHGVITAFDSSTGKFTYQPALKYFGDDKFEYVEREERVKEPHLVPIFIEVVKIARTPSIITDTIGFEMNTVGTQFELVLSDYHDPAPKSYLSLDTSTTEKISVSGLLTYLGNNRFKYTPNVNFRGNDKFEFIAKNSFGEISKKIVTLVVGNPFHNLEPSLAVRGIGCATCHLQSSSRLITDFGFGNDYFFGKDALSVASARPFDPSYSYYNDHAGASFKTAKLKEVIVPNQNLPFSPSAYLSATAPAAQLAATTLVEYVKAVVSTTVIVATKNDIFIGAPSADVIKARTALGAAETAYFKNQDSSPQLSGLSKPGTYFTASNLICDGDLVINGALFLKDLKLTTNEGCRIMVTGPIFVNGKITYVQHTSSSTNNTNLQLVSSAWINLGVGLTNCENEPSYPAAEKAWYRTNSTSLQDPMTHRLKTYASKSRLNQQDVNLLRTIQSSISTFQDASCRKSVAGEFPREEHFERLLLNAPRVDSRYTGQFTGVIIAETALMGLSSFSFSFDPVFSRVPVLPLLKPSDYLVVK